MQQIWAAVLLEPALRELACVQSEGTLLLRGSCCKLAFLQLGDYFT